MIVNEISLVIQNKNDINADKKRETQRYERAIRKIRREKDTHKKKIII